MTLPGLDPSNISFIAYWNFLDNGGADIDPTETLSAMETSQEYSNGIDGTIPINQADKVNRLVNCRVKDDGWIIVWIDRTEVYQTLSDDVDSLEGPYDVLNDWTEESNNPNLSANSLERVISTLHGELSNSGQATYNVGDVALYNYMWPDATTYTLVSTVGDDTTTSYDTTVVDGTTLHGYIVAGGTYDGYTEWNGVEVSNTTYQRGTYNAYPDVTDGNTYTSTAQGLDFRQSQICELIGWS